MTLTSALLAFALVAGLITITPGLDVALILRAALRDGRRAAATTALGICSGLLVWGLAAGVGVSALISASATAFTALKLVGAAYMLYLGVRMLMAAARGGQQLDLQEAARVSVRQREHFQRGFLTNLLNPKIGAFYVALLPQFMAADVDPAAMGLLLALVHVAETMLFFAVVILAAHGVRGLLQRPLAQRVVDAVTGTVLVAFGIKLATSR